MDTHIIDVSAERWRSPAAESGSAADAVGSQVQRFVMHLSLRISGLATIEQPHE
jgi:hypothetical protein